MAARCRTNFPTDVRKPMAGGRHDLVSKDLHGFTRDRRTGEVKSRPGLIDIYRERL